MADPRKTGPLGTALEREMSDIRVRRKVQFGLAPKFTLPVVSVITLVVILFGVVVYGHMARALDDELDRTGTFAAALAASPELDSWEGNYNTVANLRRRLATIESDLQLASGNLTVDPKTTSSDAEKDILKKLQEFDDQQRRFNQDRLNSLRETQGALDVLITGQGSTLIASASGISEARFQPTTTRTEAGTRVESGRFTRAKEDPIRARAFSHPILNLRRQRVGTATVIFSEESLAAQLDELRRSILLFCGVAIFGCAAVAFLTSRIITRPLTFLVKDIEEVASGNLQHKTLIRSSDELGVLASSFDGMTRNLAAAERMRQDLRQKDHEVRVAHEIQERLFRAELPSPKGLRLDARNLLAGELSADLFDAVELEDGRVAALVMTASGRGIPGAIVLSMARSLGHAIFQQTSDPAQFLMRLNALLTPDLKRGLFVSAMVAVIHPQSGKVTLASAGHRVPALHFVSQKSGLARIQPDGIALGLDRGPVFDRSLVCASLTLAPHDALILATDGVCAIKADDGSEIGETGFMKAALAAARAGTEDLPSRIVDTLVDRSGGQPREQDIAVICAVHESQDTP